MKTSYYNKKELDKMGFKSIGENLQISRNSKFYGISRISIGNNTRIDDFCVISAGEGGIEIGEYVHIAVYVSMQGNGKITISDFAGVSSRSSIYSSNSDYSGRHLACPNVPSNFSYSVEGDVILCKHSLVGSGSIIMPGVTLKEGSVVGALSFVKNDCEEYSIYAGNPAMKIKDRYRNIMKLEEEIRGKL